MIFNMPLPSRAASCFRMVPCRRILQNPRLPIGRRAEPMRTISRKASLETGLVSVCLLLLMFHVAQGQNRELFASAANPRVPTAALGGTVVDDNDAMVPEASVLVREISKGIEKQTKTD